ncbi:putative secreted protein [Sorangium cellulosum So ce56]|uniref:Secreted protein n=1 Tax=Sorangium cellulosum (strain So ce56) TaxID=448385 RepID=A9FYB5_SORC5|nr:DUF5819 family protein [Sorangium cellulosum]CAN95603.1 putative secreted protein [Sorangium cellulosum So ce56]
MRRLLRVLSTSAPALLAAALCFHFAMTLAYLTPQNPLQLRFARLISGYMNPFFEQNWHLFAPDPITDTRLVMVACRLNEPDGSTTETGWTDITTPYWESHLENRLGPATRLGRSVTGAARMIYTVDPTSLQMAKKLDQQRARAQAGGGGAEAPDAQVAERLRDEVKKEQDAGVQLGKSVLERAGSAHCDSLYGRSRTAAVRLRLAVLKFPRFSRRDLPDSKGELTYYDFDWAPYRPVAPLDATTEDRRKTPVALQAAAAEER